MPSIKVENCSQSPIEFSDKTASELANKHTPNLRFGKSEILSGETVRCSVSGNWIDLEVVVDEENNKRGLVFCCTNCNFKTHSHPGYLQIPNKTI